MTSRNHIFAILFLLLPLWTTAQKKYSLEQMISLAQEGAPDAIRAELQLRQSIYGYQSFKGSYLPSLNLNGNLPDFNRNVQPIVQDDGTTDFIEVSNLNSLSSISARQRIGLTGGQLFVNSGIQGFADFQTGVRRFSATPIVSVGLSQPLFQANPYRWDKKIEPLKVKIARKQYVESMEQIAMNVSNMYFDLLLSQISIEIATKNVSLNDTLYKIARGRYNLGKIAENQLLQMKLSYMNSRRDLKQARLSYQSNRLRLIRFLDLEEGTKFELILSQVIPEFEIDKTLAFTKALENKARIMEFERQRLENEKELRTAVTSNNFNADLQASYGFASRSDNIGQLYQNPLNQSGFTVGVSIPLYSGGRNRSQIKMARVNYDLRQLDIEQQQESFEMDIKLFIEQFPLLKEQLELAFESDTIAMNRYDIAVKRYMIGKTDITDLNIALNERNQAKRNLLSALKSYWEGYYKLRFYTLYDFRKGEDISYDSEI